MKTVPFVPVFFLFFNVAVCQSNPGYVIREYRQEDYIVEVENGKVKGNRNVTSHNKEMYSFYQIPYALPPVENLRFKKPQPARNWTGILHQTEITKICWESRPFKEENNPLEDEDCLYINVHIPKMPSRNKELYPVAVYVYGGAFTFGSPVGYSPQLMVEAEVIFVTFNFRTGVFGFMNTEDGVIPANLALWDQNFALKWIQRNIQYFGGDPKKVTLIGHSSGAAGVSYQMLSEESAGLFRSVIVQSLGAIQLNSLMTNSSLIAREVAKTISNNFSEKNTTQDIYRLFMKTSASILANLTFPVPDIMNGSVMSVGPRGFGPATATGDSEDNFIKEPVYENMQKGYFNRVPLMTGITSEEILGLPINDLVDTMAEKYDNDSGSLILEPIRIKGNKRAEYANELKKLYTNSTYSEDHAALGRMLSDLNFGYNSIMQAELHSRYCHTFFYKFSYVGELNIYSQNIGLDIKGLTGAGHADELYYFLVDADGTAFVNETTKFELATLLTRYRLAKLWTNFIKYGNPTPNKEPLLGNIIWPEFSRKLQFLDINRELRVQEDPRNYTKWLPLFEKYYERPINYI